MDKRKLLYELGERTANPLEAEQCKTLIKSIENEKSHMGKIIIELLEDAEEGAFK